MAKTAFRKLVRYLADGKEHSEPELLADLGIDNESLFVLIDDARKAGVDISNANGRCYISDGMQLLAQDSVLAEINEDVRAKIAKLAILESVDSTSEYLRRLNLKAKDQAQVVASEYQQSGRGRLHRFWASPYGANIYLSLFYPFVLPATKLQGLSLAVGVVIAEVLREFGVKEAKLKWPNDVMVNDKKLAGILLDYIKEEAGLFNVIIGIGINVKMPAYVGKSIDRPWTDLQQVLGKAVNRSELLGKLIDKLLPSLAIFAAEGFKPFLSKWQKSDALFGKVITISNGAQRSSGTAIGITQNGELLLRDENGCEHAFMTGEVTSNQS